MVVPPLPVQGVVSRSSDHRVVAGLLGVAPVPPVGAAVWGDTRLELGDALAGRYRDLFTGEILEARDTVAVADVLRRFPVAALERVP